MMSAVGIERRITRSAFFAIRVAVDRFFARGSRTSITFCVAARRGPMRCVVLSVPKT